MDKVKSKSIKRSMAATFFITICVIAVLSVITIFTANQAQQKILNKRILTISSPEYILKENTGEYVLDINENNAEWQPLSVEDSIAYYGCYAAMIGLPILYIVIGIGVAAKIYYRTKLRIPIAQLQKGINRIQNNDLDFSILYDSDDELGQLCHSMEKMRKELHHNNRALWESLEQRKLLNSSVAHDLRTPLTVLRGYMYYLEKNVLQNKLTKETLVETLDSMQGALERLERYVDCVRDIEKIESIEIERKTQDTVLLLNEIDSNIRQLSRETEIIFTSKVLESMVNIDKYVFFRILENLLQNALRYANKKVEVDISQNDNSLIITVKDDGKGFTDTDLIQAATLFYSNDKGNEHFGIGLSVCKLLCEKHGGSLNITNNDKSGACVIAALDISPVLFSKN